MSGMIRLRPTQILLTTEEVNRAFRKLRPSSSEFPLLSSSTLPWNHKISARRHRKTRGTEKTSYDFTIHEDPPMTTQQVESGEAEISDMSDFSFGPIHFRRTQSDGRTLIGEANGSSEAGYEGSDEEHGSESTSWDGQHSATTLNDDTPASGNFTSSALIDGSISSTDEQQDIVWDIDTDAIKYEASSGQEGSFIDTEYMADIELSVPGDSGLSTQDSDTESGAQESYSLPMDGTNEKNIIQAFQGINLNASPVSTPLRPLTSSRRRVMTTKPKLVRCEQYDLNTDDSDGGIEISEWASDAETVSEIKWAGIDDSGRVMPKKHSVNRHLERTVEKSTEDLFKNS